MTRSRPAAFLASAVPDAPPARRRRRLLELPGHRWTPAERAILISLVAIALGSLAGGSLVDNIGVPVDFWFGSILALLGLGAIVSFRIKNEKPGALA